MPNRSGQQLEHYRLLKRLGGGTFGDVYLAEDMHKRANHPHRQVAIKILHGEFNDTQLQDFLKEARIIRLRHPNIISVLDFGIESSSKTPFIVMEYITGGTCSTIIPKAHACHSRPLSPTPHKLLPPCIMPTKKSI